MAGAAGEGGPLNIAGKLLNESSRWTALLRLEKDQGSLTRKEADLTFRVLVLLKYQWERQIRMLDRRDDGYIDLAARKLREEHLPGRRLQAAIRHHDRERPAHHAASLIDDDQRERKL